MTLPTSPLPLVLGDGARLLVEGHWFEAHERWEADWRALPPGPEKRAVQGLIHLAVALEHRRRGSLRPAAGQWAKAKDKLGGAQLDLPLDLSALLTVVAPCLDAATEGRSAPLPDLAPLAASRADAG